jgi:hypothetical protein
MMDEIKKIAIKTNVIAGDITHQPPYLWAVKQYPQLASMSEFQRLD